MQQKVEAATALAKTASGLGLALGWWLSDNWLAVLSALFIILTYATQVYFNYRRDRREQTADKRERELHMRQLDKLTEIASRNEENKP